MKILNKEYICKQLWLIESELEDVYNTMTEHGFDLTSNDVINLMDKVNTRVGNIKRELNRWNDIVSEKINKLSFASLDISKPGRPEVKEEINKYLDFLL